jgi:hypothetical protein
MIIILEFFQTYIDLSLIIVFTDLFVFMLALSSLKIARCFVVDTVAAMKREK